MEQLDTGIPFPAEDTINGKKILYDTVYKPGYDVVLGSSDVLEFLKGIKQDKFMLIVTSPPYNMGKPYEEPRKFSEYIKWQTEIAQECIRLLDDRGSICWEIGNYLKNREVFPLDYYFYKIFTDVGLKLRNRIIWRYGHGLSAKVRFSGRYEVILWFTKGDDYIFNLDPVRIPQKYPGKRSYKGPSKGKPSSNRLGKNPSDIWDIIKEDWENEVWDIPNVKAKHLEKTEHPAQFPIELVERLVLALTNEGDAVLDPFVGVGSSIIAATLNGRRAVGVDKERNYTDKAWERIIDALNGRLRRRPMEPVFAPNGTEKVAKPPPEWNLENLVKWTRELSSTD